MQQHLVMTDFTTFHICRPPTMWSPSKQSPRRTWPSLRTSWARKSKYSRSWLNCIMRTWWPSWTARWVVNILLCPQLWNLICMMRDQVPPKYLTRWNYTPSSIFLKFLPVRCCLLSTLHDQTASDNTCNHNNILFPKCNDCGCKQAMHTSALLCGEQLMKTPSWKNLKASPAASCRHEEEVEWLFLPQM